MGNDDNKNDNSCKVVKIEKEHLKGVHDCYYGSSKKSRKFFSYLEKVKMPELLDTSKYFLTVCAIYNGEIAGYGHLEKFPQNYKKHIARLGIFVNESNRGKGIANKIMEELVNYAKKKNLKKIWLACYHDNLRAMRLYEKFGFKVEGVFFGEEIRGRKVSDLLSMSLYLNRKKDNSIPWSRPAIHSEEVFQLLKTVQSGWLSQGKITKNLEHELSKKFKSRNAIVMNNGTSALMAAFATVFRPNDKVLFPTFTFVSTLNSAIAFGIRPVLADIESDTGNIDLDKAENILKKDRTIKGIVPVDIAGHSVDIKRVYELSNDYGLNIVEDAAEAIGGKSYKKPIGSFGHPTIFSFHAAKNITTIEGGVVLVNDDEIANKIRQFRNNGESLKTKFVWDEFGLNFRMTDLQASIGLAQIKKLDEFIRNRNLIMEYYKSELSDLVDFQTVKNYVDIHPYMMGIAYLNPNKLKIVYEELKKRSIYTRMCWSPMHKQPAFGQTFKNVKLPISEIFSKKAICLPLYNDMTMSDAERVAYNIKNILNKM